MPPPFFRRSQSVLTTAAELATANPPQHNGTSNSSNIPTPVAVIQKSKSFKRIRGLLKVATGSGGESRRERRAAARRASATTTGRQEQQSGTPSDTATTPTATNLSSITTNTAFHNNNNNSVADSSFISGVSGNVSMLPDMDDVSTIQYYNVDVDDRSVITQTTVSNNLFGTTPSDNNNNNMATTTADERFGRDIHPTGTTNPNDTIISNYILKVVLLLMDPETRRFELLQLEFDSLKAYVSDVLAQIPISVTEDSLRQQHYTAIANQYSIEMISTKLLASFCKGNEVLVAIPQNISVSECIRLARPILSDENVVAMLLSSGIDASGWKEDPSKKKKKSSILKGNDGIVASSTSRTVDDVHNDDDYDVIPLRTEPYDHRNSSKEMSKSDTTGGSSSLLFTLVCVILVGLIVQIFHIYISAPINVGSTISPGVWLSKCGLFSLVPSYCHDNAYVHFHRNGTISYYNSEKITTWIMEGGVCPEEIDPPPTPSTTVTACIRGMHIQNDGKIIVGGKVIHHVITYGNAKKEPPLSPWPFVEPPKLKVWRK